MFTHKNLMTVCCAAVLAFGLAACGSSSSDDVKVMDPGKDTPPKPEVIVDQPPTDDKIAAKTKEAGTKATAIGVEFDQTAVDGPGDDGPGGVAEDADHVIAISRDGDGTTVTITVTDAAADDPKFIMQDVDLEQFEKNGFSSTMHVLKMDAGEDGNVVEEVVIVSTDIDAPTDIPFVDDGDGNGGRYTLNTNPDGEENSQSLTFDATEVTGHAGLAMLTDSKVAVPAPSGSVTLMGDNEDTEDVKENEYSGTFDGAEGTFTCTGTVADGCAVMIEDGEITTMVNVYFTPDDEDVMVKEDDADYLNYGFWLKRTTDEDGVLTYNEVETFAGSLIPATTSVADVVGTAEYNGGATGVYVKNVYNPDRTIASATAGFFTADVELMAYFGGPDVNATQEDTVTGTIDQFVLEHGEDNMWSVALEGRITETDSTVTGTANGGGDPGSFDATFHGPTPPTESMVDNEAFTVAPGSVVGEFNANFSDGTAAGGFGARK